MNKTTIEWTNYTWNPVTGCHKVSPGCKNCYAETLTKRFGKQWGMESFRDVQMHPDRLHAPLRMLANLMGKRVFVCDMSDLFHEDVTDEFIIEVLMVIKICPDTTFQVLTKRVDRALAILSKIYLGSAIISLMSDSDFAKVSNGNPRPVVPIPNLWIGVSVENQQTAEERIPLLLQIPAAVRFLSCEPLLGPIDLFNHLYGKKSNTTPWNDIHWVIAGGESGRNARPMQPSWARYIRYQCNLAGVPFFFKQWGEYAPLSQAGINPGKIALTQGDVDFIRLGKNKSGHLLDGVAHREFPKVK